MCSMMRCITMLVRPARMLRVVSRRWSSFSSAFATFTPNFFATSMSPFACSRTAARWLWYSLSTFTREGCCPTFSITSARSLSMRSTSDSSAMCVWKSFTFRLWSAIAVQLLDRDVIFVERRSRAPALTVAGAVVLEHVVLHIPEDVESELTRSLLTLPVSRPDGDFPHREPELFVPSSGSDFHQLDDVVLGEVAHRNLQNIRRSIQP